MLEYISNSKCSYLEINFVIIAFCILKRICIDSIVLLTLQYPSRSVYKQVCFFLQGVMGEMGPPGSPVCILSFNLLPGLIQNFPEHDAPPFLVFILIRFLSINFDWFDEHVCKFLLNLRVSQVLQCMVLLCKDGSRERRSLRDHHIKETKLKLQRFEPQCKR